MDIITKKIDEKISRNMRRSASVTESNDQKRSTKAEEVKQKLLARSFKNKGLNRDKIQRTELANCFHEMTAAYYGERLHKQKVESTASDDAWQHVVLSCRAANVSPQRYIKAQFDYFSKTYGCPARLKDLGTEEATNRARDFEGETTGRIVGAIEYKVDLREICQQSEDMLQNICKAQKLDRADCYRFLISTGMTSRLHKEFRKMDPVYQEVLKEFNP